MQTIKSARIPLAWSRNPSSLRLRSRVAALGAVSSVSVLFLIPVIGDVAPFLISGFLLTSILSLIGASSRWRTSPWLVLTNLVVSLAFVLIPVFVFAIVRPALENDPSVIGYALSLLAAIMTGYIGDEWLASMQTLKRLSEHGRKMHRTFFGLSPLKKRAREYST
ncbi:MAG: hypothetical protein EOP05_06140 [Proteobacteria bacterium]|nr:MAG: hypothetical protein EOP05_11785 [Pseudomonadota bacterium]RYZ76057.1 MAG: hypothetical protein EOP05_06140 [Pseudomonadota bacterium]